MSFIVIRSDKHFRMKVILRYLCLEDDKPSDVSALSACMPICNNESQMAKKKAAENEHKKRKRADSASAVAARKKPLFFSFNGYENEEDEEVKVAGKKMKDLRINEGNDDGCAVAFEKEDDGKDLNLAEKDTEMSKAESDKAVAYEGILTD